MRRLTLTLPTPKVDRSPRSQLEDLSDWHLLAMYTQLVVPAYSANEVRGLVPVALLGERITPLLRAV